MVAVVADITDISHLLHLICLSGLLDLQSVYNKNDTFRLILQKFQKRIYYNIKYVHVEIYNCDNFIIILQ